MALTDPGGGGGSSKQIAKLPKAVPPPVSTQPIDDTTAYQLFAPQAGGATTTQGPQGGTINYAAGADPNGYFWVDDGSDAGYWYRPEDKNVWRSSPVTQAADRVLTNLPGPVKAPVTYAPVIRGALPPPPPVPPSSGGGGILGKIGGIAQDLGGTALDAVGQAVPVVGLGEAAIEAGGAIARNIGVPLPEPSRAIPTPGRSPLRDYGALTTSVLPRAVTETIAQDVGPVERALEFSTSPLGIWSAGISSATSPFAPSVGAAIDVASNLTGELAAEGAKRAGLPTWAQVGANVLGGIGPDLGFGVAGAARGVPDAFPTYRGPRDAGGNPVPSSIAPPIPFPAPPTLARQIDDILSPEGTRLPEPVAVPTPPLPRIAETPAPVQSVPPRPAQVVRPPVEPAPAFGGGGPLRVGKWMVYFDDPADRAAYIAKDAAIRQAVKDAPTTGEVRGQMDSFGGAFSVKRIPAQGTAPDTVLPPVPTRTVPSGAAVASTKKPPVNTEYAVFPNKPRNMTEVAVKVGEADAGVIRRIGTTAKWEAYYRNPDGAMVPVPKNAAGEPFVGTKVQAQNVVVNAHLADGKVLQDVPKGVRAPRAGVTLYHGTSKDAAANIRASGFGGDQRIGGIAPGASEFERSLVFLSPSRTSANYYATDNSRIGNFGGPDVIEVAFSGRTFDAPGAHSIYDAARALGVREVEGVFDVDDFRVKLRAAGYDAVSFRDSHAGNRQAVAVFDTSKLTPRGAPRAAAAVEAAPATPGTSLEATLAASLDDIRARKAAVEGVVSPAPRSAPEVAPSTPTPRATGSPYDAEQAAARHAANPYKGGETVTYKGETYTVERPVSTKTAKGTVEGVRISGPKGESIRVPVTEVQRTVLRPQEMTIRQMVREMDPVIPSQVRQDFYKIATQEDRAAKFGAEKLTDAQRAAVTDVRERLQDMLGIYRRQQEEIATAAIPRLTEDPAVALAAQKAALGTATDGEVAALDAIHREALESMAAGIEDAVPSRVSAPVATGTGKAPDADDVQLGRENLLGFIDEEFTKARKEQAGGRRTVRAGRRLGRATVNTLGAARSLKASIDASFIRRQGGVLGIRHPRIAARALRRTMRNLDNPQVAGQIMDEINAVSRPGLYIAQLDEAVLTLREESMMSSVASKIPGIRRLERANVVYLNKLRADVYDEVVAGWRAFGGTPTEDELWGLANFINHASGRGTGDWLDKFGPALGLGLFSPRYTVSRYQVLTDPFTLPGKARRYAAETVAINLGVQASIATSILFLLQHSGLDVEIDPRSSDFGKIRFPGGFVVDFTSGMQQPIRFIAQLSTQSYKSTASGEVYPRSLQESALRMLRAKASPLGSEVMDWFNVPYAFDETTHLTRIPGVPDSGFLGDAINAFDRTTLPIILGNAAEFFQNANTPLEYMAALAATAAEFLGEGVSYRAPGEWEIRDQKIAADPEMAQYLLPGETVLNYNNLNDVGRAVAQERYGVPVSKNPDTINRREKVAAIDAKYAPREGALEEARAGWFSSDPAASDISPKDARAKARQISAEKRAETSTLYPEDIPVDERRVLDRWFAAIEQYTDALGDTDWDAIEAWEGQQSAEDRAILHEVQRMWSEEKTGIAGDDRRVADALSDSGFFELRDQAWVEYANAERIDLQQFPDVWTYKASVRAAKIAEYEPVYGASMARQQAAKDADKAVTDFGDHYEQRYLRPWMLEHTDLARQGADFQYISVDQEELKAIYMGDAAGLQSERQKFDAKKGLERADYVYTPGETTNEQQIANITALYRSDPELARAAYANNLLGSLGKADKEALAKAGVVLE